MDYKKAYNEALERAKKMLASKRSVIVEKQALETIFPELQESVDERIRKELLDYLHTRQVVESLTDTKVKMDWITWLENQDRQMIAKGERKNIALSIINYLDNNRVAGCMDLSSMECEDIEDACVNSKWTKLYNYMKKKLETQDTPKDYNSIDPHFGKPIDTEPKDYNSIDPHFGKPIDTEPKFKVGDWAAADRINFRSPTKIVDISDTEYRVEDTKGNSGMPKIDYFDSRYHLWSIADAKDGDVLISACNHPFIYNGNNNSSLVGGYCGIATASGFKISTEECRWTENINIHPATKEQQNYLFQKMREAGYMWDSYTKSVFCSINRNPND